VLLGGLRSAVPGQHHGRGHEQTEADAKRATEELGWVRTGGANELLAIYHPGQRDHKVILKRDLPVWESKGYFAEPTVVYHPEEGEKLVSAEEAKGLLNDGWYDSPAHFSKASTKAIVEKAVKAAKAAKAG
jgi:hypothetical protein